MMRADESDETIASQSHRFGKHISGDYLETCYNAPQEVLENAPSPLTPPDLGAEARAMDDGEGARREGRQPASVRLPSRPLYGAERLPLYPQPQPELARDQNAVFVRDLSPSFEQGMWFPAIITQEYDDGTYGV